MLFVAAADRFAVLEHVRVGKMGERGWRAQPGHRYRPKRLALIAGVVAVSASPSDRERN